MAQGSVAPTTASVNAVLAGNAAIKAAFGPGQTYFAIGELGAAHASRGADSETATASFATTIDSGALTTTGDLMIGLYGGTVVGGAGVTNVTLSVTSNGTVVLPVTSFATGAAAAAFFKDHPIDLGAIAADTVLDLSVNLSVTSTASNAGFYGNFILGTRAPALPASALEHTGTQVAGPVLLLPHLA